VSAGAYFSHTVRPKIASGQFLEWYLANVSLLERVWYVNEFSVISRCYVDLVICCLLGYSVMVTATPIEVCKIQIPPGYV
jgi:hypothetical protein